MTFKMDGSAVLFALREPMPTTLHLDASNAADLAQAAELLRVGRLVAFPTETVYGLGANALDISAVARIFEAKQRPAWDPLIVHVAQRPQIPEIAAIPAEFEQRIERLAAAFWPGPLTLLLPRRSSVPDAVTAGRDLVGVRIPAHPVAYRLLEAAGVPVAAPSANLFGHTSPTTAAHVVTDLEGRIDAVLDGGATAVGVESTVLDPTRTPMVLYRPGAVTAEQLHAVSEVEVETFAAERAPAAPESLPSPGVGIRHYAPRARLILTEPNSKALLKTKEQWQGKGRCGLLLPSDWPSMADAAVFDWGSWNEPQTLAARLYAGLRALDDQGVAFILAPLPANEGMGRALCDRLEKAARLE